MTQQPNPAQVVTATAQPITEPQPEPAPAMDTNQLSILMNIAGEMSQALNLCLTGDQYADQFCFKHGQALYDQIIAQPKDTVLSLLKGIPQAWQMLQPFEGGLQEFVDSFYAYAQQEDEDAPKNISQPVSEPVKPKKAKKTKQ